MYAKMKAFENKFGLWELQFTSNNLAYVQPLRTEKPTDAKKCAEEIPILQEFEFEILVNMRSLSVCFQFSLILMSKLSQISFSWNLICIFTVLLGPKKPVSEYYTYELL